MNDRNSEKERIMNQYRVRQTRQILAITAAIFLVLLAAVIHKRPDLFGTYSRSSLFAAQAITIAVFLGFTNWNWRCPSCAAFLSSDIYRRRCKKCGTHLQ
ncbi:MAG: hypothetical protein OEW15_03390 [Nitrospirota bacterium]|nr:hypothetical protein [Nitrospirota bacterium]